ncbi:MAG: endonuclease/exonuclease/phosphatase family protein [Kiloniellales bacterium]
MIEVLSWNIQCGLGVDGRHDLVRIAGTVRALGDPDVICLQEVCRFMPALDGEGADQVAALARLFPSYEALFGPGLEWRPAPAGDYRQIGNLILSRLPVESVSRHVLPRPAHQGVKHMQRQALEVTLRVGESSFRVMTTHLEFHSERQRRAQVERLRVLQREALDNHAAPPLPVAEGPYAQLPRPADCVLCGDFNLVVDDEEYRLMLAEDGGAGPLFRDAWTLARGDEPHQPTCGLFDREQWPQGPHCRDFFFVTPGLAPALAAFAVDVATAASDHQPLSLRLDIA